MMGAPGGADWVGAAKALHDFCERDFPPGVIDDEDLQKLWRAGYKNALLIGTARKQSLKDIGLSIEATDRIVAAQQGMAKLNKVSTEQAAARQPDTAELYARLRRLELGQEEIMRSLSSRADTMSSSARGNDVLDTFKIGKYITRCSERGEGAAVLTPDEQAELSALSCEKDVVKFLTPILISLRAQTEVDDDLCPAILVNSEDPWLNHHRWATRPDNRLKPHLFRTWSAFVDRKGPKPALRPDESLCYGTLAHHYLQMDGCAREFYEATVRELTPATFGVLYRYHEWVGGHCKGMLLNRTEFWLYESNGPHPVRLLQGAWTTPGSADVISTFYRGTPQPKLLTVLQALLKTLNVQLEGLCPFLGAGAAGRVFRVRSGHQVMALKVVFSELDDFLGDEFELLEKAWNKGAPVIGVVQDSLRLIGDGGGYLLSAVGQPVQSRAWRSPRMYSQALGSLKALHDTGVIHGDARIQNLLSVDETLVWIDLRPGAAQSCLRWRTFEPTPEWT